MNVSASAFTNRARLLILDDDPADAKMILHALEGLPEFVIEADIARTREQFVHRMSSGAYDAILADYHMPGWTGLDAIRWVKGSGYRTPIILVTGTLSDEQAVECFKQGASDYVLKDKIERLPIAVNLVIEQEKLRAARDQAVEELRKSEEQYRLLFRSNPQPMWVYDLESLQFLAVNDAAVAHYGYSREEFLAMTIREIRPEEDIPSLLRKIEQSPESGLDSAGTWRHRKRNGTIFEVEITSQPLLFGGRRAELVLANDLSELMKGTRDLRRSEERFQKIFQASPEPVTISTLSDGRYLDVNESFLQVHGYERQEIIGQSARQIFWVDLRERGRFTQMLLEQGRVRNLEIRFHTKSGEVRTGQVSAEIIELDGQPCILAVTQDVTERKRLEQQFLQAQKMEAVGRLAGGVAHDFNNLLMIISSSAQLMQDKPQNLESIAKYTAQIRDASEKAAALTRQLLAFSRKQVSIPALLDLNFIITDLFKMLPRLLGEDIEIVISKSDELGAISADRGHIEQIIMNLVVNARDAMPNGGRLMIETRNIELDGEGLALHGVKGSPGSYVMLAISDTGIGMNEETKSRIFEPFFTTKELGKGTGLGLATVYGIVKQNDGWIWVYSEPEKGTAFKIYLPRTEKKAVPSAVTSEVESSTGSETILLVEDEPGLRQVTAEYLESKGYRVLQADNGPAAMRIISEYDGPIDVLITDLIMPGFGGLKLVEDSLPKRPGMRVILVSGYTERAVSDEVTKNNAEFLQKPFSLNQLTRTIRAVVDKRPR